MCKSIIMKSKLKELGVQYVPIEGKYGNIEHSFMLFNIVREDAQYLADQVKQRCGVKDVFIYYTGAVIGSHSGPGTLALFYLGEHR